MVGEPLDSKLVSGLADGDALVEGGKLYELKRLNKTTEKNFEDDIVAAKLHGQLFLKALWTHGYTVRNPLESRAPKTDMNAKNLETERGQLPIEPSHGRLDGLRIDEILERGCDYFESGCVRAVEHRADTCLT